MIGWTLLGRPADDATMLELLEPMRPHRHRVVSLLEVSGLAYEAAARQGPAAGAEHLVALACLGSLGYPQSMTPGTTIPAGRDRVQARIRSRRTLDLAKQGTWEKFQWSVRAHRQERGRSAGLGEERRTRRMPPAPHAKCVKRERRVTSVFRFRVRTSRRCALVDRHVLMAFIGIDATPTAMIAPGTTENDGHFGDHDHDAGRRAGDTAEACHHPDHDEDARPLGTPGKPDNSPSRQIAA